MLIRNLFRYWTYQLFSPGTVLKEKYAAFKSLLTHDKRAHELMAELEEIYYHGQKRDFCAVQLLSVELSQQVAGIVADLSRICPTAYTDLQEFYQKIDTYLRYITVPDAAPSIPPYLLALEDIGADDLQRVGGKAHNLGIVQNQLGLPVPKGFVMTTHAYHLFLKENDLRKRIDDRLAILDIEDLGTLDAVSVEIQALIATAQLPEPVVAALTEGFATISELGSEPARVAMRSSAVGEDSRASFAGQYLSVLNVQEQDLAATYKRIIAGKYSSEAIYYRISYGLSDEDTAMAVLVLDMIPAVSSGVVYTTDMEDPESEHMKIHAIWGLGELLVSGQTPADILTLSKSPPHFIIEKRVAEKSHQMVIGEAGEGVSEALVGEASAMLSLDDLRATQLARWAMTLEAHYQVPQDIEWATDPSGKTYILQSRPLHSGVQIEEGLTCTFEDIPNEVLLHSGECAAAGIGAGLVFNATAGEDLSTVPQNAVFVAVNALPLYAKVIHRLSAIVVDAGSSAGHLASVAREFGIPMLVNTRTATSLLTHGRPVTVHAEGRAIYDGTVAEMVASPCAKVDLIIDSPFMRNLQYIMSFATALELVDPNSETFTPQNCRSFHDIIRFSHEKAVQEMFHISDNRMRKLSFAKKLASDIPMLFYILDVGGGVRDGQGTTQEISIEDVTNMAMRALWQGLSHPDIQWGSFSHFDWEAHDRMVMSGGIASPEATMFASHAVISDDYMNLNLRFGYHFVIVDALCGAHTSDPTILFRFSGGGADMAQRMLRTEFLSKILRRLGFEVNVKSDLIDGQFKGTDAEDALQRLDMIGRLLGATRLMDMYLKDAALIDGFVDDFMGGRYHFASVELT